MYVSYHVIVIYRISGLSLDLSRTLHNTLLGSAAAVAVVAVVVEVAVVVVVVVVVVVAGVLRN